MSVVAHLDGPFVVDLHKGGPITGQGGAPEQATPLGVIPNQSDNGGGAFDPTATYGFGFSTVPAMRGAYNVNLTADEAADFALMIAEQLQRVLPGAPDLEGRPVEVRLRRDERWYGHGRRAVGRGRRSRRCPHVHRRRLRLLEDAQRWHRPGRLGFSTPTSYVNCQNMTLMGMPQLRRGLPARHPGLYEPVDDRAGDSAHGPPVLGELR